MINWTLVAIIPLAAAMGAEFGRRKLGAKGEIYSFMPPWQHRLLTPALGVAVILFVESAKAALSDPTPYHLWLLIGSAAAAQAVQLTLSALELSNAKKHLGHTRHGPGCKRQ